MFLSGAIFLIFMGNLKETFQEALTKDYQETQEFRRAISEKLNNCLAVAVDSEEEIWLHNVVPPNINTNISILESEEGWSENWDDDPKNRDESIAKTERLRSLSQEKDKNLIFSIFLDGKCKLSNTDELEWNKMDTILPEEYNFLLYFDGEKAGIMKDGKPLDIYGDGVYGGSDWYIPGYLNVSTDEEVKKAEVYIAAKKQPLQYSYWDFTRKSRAIYYKSGDLYYVYHNHIEKRNKFFCCSVFLILGAVLIILYWLMRKDKAAADRWIAQKTEKVLIECKILLCLVSAAIMVLMCNTTGVYESWAVFFTVPFIWSFYWLANHLRYCKNPWSHSFLSKIIARNLHYSISKRFSRIFLLPILETILFLTAAECLIVYVNAVQWNESILMVALPFWFASLVLLVSLLACARRTQKTAVQLETVLNQLHAVRQGEPVQLLGFDPGAELRDAMDDLNHIQQGFEDALQEKIKNERLKIELITNVSHDIKTPLTSIVSYIDLLKQEELPPATRDYVQILEQKTLKLKEMVQDVFDVSKAAAHQLTLQKEKLDFGKLIRQTLADMDDEISKSPCSLRTEIPDTPAPVQADGQRMYRVFQNLLQNALLYSLEGSRIYLSLREEEGYFTASIKNTSKAEIPGGIDFTERFVRGDKSRTDGGSGLGLSIAKSFTEACGGGFRIITNADLFTAEVRFPKAD